MMTLQCVEKVFININAQMFQLKQKILGDGNLKYISDETKARVTLRGRGSDFIEASGSESNEPMHLFIEHSNFKGVGDAKALVKNLLETVQQDLAMQNGQQNCQAPAIQPQSIIQSVSIMMPRPECFCKIMNQISAKPTNCFAIIYSCVVCSSPRDHSEQ